MKSTFSFSMSGCRRFVAIETLQFADLFCFQRSGLFFLFSQIVFVSLEIRPPAPVRQINRFIGNLPVGGDCYCVALVAAARSRDTLPGAEHGAPLKQKQHGKNR